MPTEEQENEESIIRIIKLKNKNNTEKAQAPFADNFTTYISDKVSSLNLNEYTPQTNAHFFMFKPMELSVNHTI